MKRWQRTAAVGDRLPSQLSRQPSIRERSSGKRRELAGAREQKQRQPPRTTTSSHAATATGSVVRGSASTATAGAAAIPRTDIYGRKFHCLPRQTDGNKNNNKKNCLSSALLKENLSYFPFTSPRKTCQGKTCQEELASVYSRQFFLDKGTCQGKLASVNEA